MSECYNTIKFKEYFTENMKALGAPVPNGLFDSYQKAVGTATVIVGSLYKLGKGATVAELIVATTGLEKLVIAAAFGATLYVGMVIGSIAVAVGRLAGCGASIADMFVFTHRKNLRFKGWSKFYIQNPKILDRSLPFRNSIGLRGKQSPASFEYA